MRPVALAFALAFAPAVGSDAHAAQAAGRIRDVQVVAKKFTFEPAAIMVTEGERVRLIVRSADTVHGVQIRALHLDLQVPQGGEAIAEFTAPPAGRYAIACSEFCGIGHARMKAALVSVTPPRLSR